MADPYKNKTHQWLLGAEQGLTTNKHEVTLRDGKAWNWKVVMVMQFCKCDKYPQKSILVTDELYGM